MWSVAPGHGRQQGEAERNGATGLSAWGSCASCTAELDQASPMRNAVASSPGVEERFLEAPRQPVAAWCLPSSGARAQRRSVVT